MQCVSPNLIRDPRYRGSSYLPVDCGKCGACKHNRRTDWTFRITEEARAHPSTVFVTLTYDETNLPLNNDGVPSLHKRDMQLYFKRLRQRISAVHQKLRYYTVGEYGTTTRRPHYHSIIFGLHRNLWPELKNAWGLGHVHAQPINAARIHYVTKYHMNYDKDLSKDLNINPEFSTQSQGIGKAYIERAKAWHRNNGYMHLINNGYVQRLPRYYKDRIFNPLEREILGERGLYEQQIQYDKEVERLSKLGYNDPEEEIFRRQFAEAQKVLKKAEEGMTL
jgi:hypothetical protein